MEPFDRVIHLADQEIDSLEKQVNRQHTILVATMVAISSLFWTVMATIQSSGFGFLEMGRVMPFFVAITFLSFLMSGTLLFYRTKHPFYNANQTSRDLDEEVHDIKTALAIVCFAMAQVSCVFVIFSLLSDPWQNALYIFIMLWGLVTLYLESFWVMYPEKLKKRIIQNIEKSAKKAYRHMAFRAMAKGLILGLGILYVSWYYDKSLSAFTLAFLTYALFFLVQKLMSEYDELYNLSSDRDRLRGIRRRMLDPNGLLDKEINATEEEKLPPISIAEP